MSTLLANTANTMLMFISKLMDIFLKTTKNENDGKMTSRFIYLGKPIFKGEIKNRKDEYDRKTDYIDFRAKYNGRLEQGYFASEIIPPQPFTFGTPHLHQESGNVTSFCETTINGDIKNDWNIHNIATNIGKLHGRNIKTGWFEWTWKIPIYAPIGEYRVIIGVWSDSNNDNNDIIPIQFSERSFVVRNPDDSHY